MSDTIESIRFLFQLEADDTCRVADKDAVTETATMMAEEDATTSSTPELEVERLRDENLQLRQDLCQRKLQSLQMENARLRQALIKSTQASVSRLSRALVDFEAFAISGKR